MILNGACVCIRDKERLSKGVRSENSLNVLARKVEPSSLECCAWLRCTDNMCIVAISLI